MLYKVSKGWNEDSSLGINLSITGKLKMRKNLEINNEIPL